MPPRRDTFADRSTAASMPASGEGWMRALKKRLLAGFPWVAKPAPRRLSLVPPPSWPGSPDRGRSIVAGRLVCGDRSFDVSHPDWAAADADDHALSELQSFAWLDDLAAVGTAEARLRAHALVASWIEAEATHRIAGGRAGVLGHRITAWLSHANFLLRNDEILDAALLESLARQTSRLMRGAGEATQATDVAAVARGLLYAGLCGFGARAATKGLRLLESAVATQILPDGGHIERSPAVHMRVLAALIDARGMLEVAGQPVPPWLSDAIARAAPALRVLRHGDGQLALFNGTGFEDRALVDAVLTRANAKSAGPAHLLQTGFVRLSAGGTVVIADVGAPPRPPHDKPAHAGTLSFEMSDAGEQMIVNCGIGRAPDAAWRRLGRATAAHSTLVIQDTNSSEILPDGGIGRRPSRVDAVYEAMDGDLWMTASHDGYATNFDIVHQRRLYLAHGGDDLRGEDTLRGRPGASFAIRFHLHPDVRASVVQSAAAVLLRTVSGHGWRLLAANASLSLDDSIYFGQPDGPRRSQQVVLAGFHKDHETVIKWALRRVGEA